jgi:amino acid permease
MLQVRHALGRFPARVLAWTIFIYIFGSCTAFMMIAGGSFQALLKRTLSVHLVQKCPVITSRWLSIVVPSSFIILPLSLLPDMGALAPTSALAVASIAMATATIVGKLFFREQARPDGVPIMPPGAVAFNWNGMLNAIPIIVFAYQCHVQSVQIHAELSPFPHLLPTRCCGRSRAGAELQPNVTQKRQGMAAVCLTTYLECTTLYLSTGLAGYLLFGKQVEANILDNFSVNDSLMLVVRILVGLAVSLHYPINLHAARTALYDLVCDCAGRTPERPVPYSALKKASVAIWSASLLVACLVTDLGKLFQVVGGFAGSLIIFVMPGLLIAVQNRTPCSDSAQADSVQGHEGVVGAAEPGVPLPATTSPGVSVREHADDAQVPLLHSDRDGFIKAASPVEDGLASVGSSGSHGAQSFPIQLTDESDVHQSRTSGSDFVRVASGWALVLVGVSIMSLTVTLTVG